MSDPEFFETIGVAIRASGAVSAFLALAAFIRGCWLDRRSREVNFRISKIQKVVGQVIRLALIVSFSVFVSIGLAMFGAVFSFAWLA